MRNSHVVIYISGAGWQAGRVCCSFCLFQPAAAIARSTHHILTISNRSRVHQSSWQSACQGILLCYNIGTVWFHQMPFEEAQIMPFLQPSIQKILATQTMSTKGIVCIFNLYLCFLSVFIFLQADKLAYLFSVLPAEITDIKLLNRVKQYT